VQRHLGSDLRDHTHDFVADREWVLDVAPLAAHGVNVGVADAGIGDLDQYVFRADLSAIDGCRDEGLGRRGRGIGLNSEQKGLSRWFEGNNG
jgi:hypothetical protein